jgi:hypothetical protein
MGRQLLKYYTVLVGLGIVVGSTTGFGNAITAGARGIATVTDSLKH